MAEDVAVFQKPEELCSWLRMNRSDVLLEQHEAEVLFGYMEGHDYRLGFDGDGIVRQDIAEEQGETVSFSIDEIIDIVCEWNYEMIEEAADGMANPKDFADFCKYKDAYDSLKKDEALLDKMFARTMYGRRIIDIVTNAIAEVGSIPPDKAAGLTERLNGGMETEMQERVR